MNWPSCLRVHSREDRPIGSLTILAVRIYCRSSSIPRGRRQPAVYPAALPARRQPVVYPAVSAAAAVPVPAAAAYISAAAAAVPAAADPAAFPAAAASGAAAACATASTADHGRPAAPPPAPPLSLPIASTHTATPHPDRRCRARRRRRPVDTAARRSIWHDAIIAFRRRDADRAPAFIRASAGGPRGSSLSNMSPLEPNMLASQDGPSNTEDAFFGPL